MEASARATKVILSIRAPRLIVFLLELAVCRCALDLDVERVGAERRGWEGKLAFPAPAVKNGLLVALALNICEDDRSVIIPDAELFCGVSDLLAARIPENTTDAEKK